MSDTRQKTKAETEAPASSRWKEVEAVPAAVRATGGERTTELKEFYSFLTSQPVGKTFLYKEGVRSPNYGDPAKFPKLQMSTRQNGTNEEGKPLFDLYATHVEKRAERKPRAAKAQPEGAGLV